MSEPQGYEMRHLVVESKALIEGEPNRIANLANLASLIFHSVPDLNWCGFYLKDADRNELILGPFQGKPACIRIPKGQGVCGSAWATGKVINIPDVHAVINHIVCDAASRSELALPIYGKDGNFYGILDLDSPLVSRFDPGTEKIVRELVSEVLPKIFY